MDEYIISNDDGRQVLLRNSGTISKYFGMFVTKLSTTSYVEPDVIEFLYGLRRSLLFIHRKYKLLKFPFPSKIGVIRDLSQILPYQNVRLFCDEISADKDITDVFLQLYHDEESFDRIIKCESGKKLFLTYIENMEIGDVADFFAVSEKRGKYILAKIILEKIPESELKIAVLNLPYEIDERGFNKMVKCVKDANTLV